MIPVKVMNVFAIYCRYVWMVTHRYYTTGGCQLNNSCVSDRQRYAPVCAVCKTGMYMSDNDCYSCSEESMNNKIYSLLAFFMMTLGVMLMLSLIIFMNLQTTPITSKAKKAAETEDVFISQDLINAMTGSKQIILVGEAKQTVSGQDEQTYEGDMGVELAPVKPTQRDRSDKNWEEKPHRKVASGLLLGNWVMRNKNGFKKFIRGASITGKITISFLQVLTGSFLTLNIKYPNYLHSFFVDFQLNPFQPIESTFKCADQSDSNDDSVDNNTESNVLFLSILMSVLCPIFFLLVLIVSVSTSRLFYFKLVYPRKREHIKDRKSFLRRQFRKSYNLSIKLYIW